MINFKLLKDLEPGDRIKIHPTTRGEYKPIRATVVTTTLPIRHNIGAYVLYTKKGGSKVEVCNGIWATTKFELLDGKWE